MITKKTKWLLMGLLCLALRPGTTQGQSSEFADTYDRFAQFYTQGRDQEALRFAEIALRLGEYESGPDHPITALLLNKLAGLHDAQGHYVETEPLYQRSLAIWEKALGPEHPHVATSLNNLALLYQAQGHYPKRTQLGTPTRNQRMPAFRVAFGTTSYFVKGGRNVPEG